MLSVNVWKLSRIPNFAGLHVAEHQRVSAAAGQPRVCRHVIGERVEVGRRQGAVDSGLEVPPGPSDVVEFNRDPRGDFLRHTSRHVPAVLALVPSARRVGIDR